MTRAPRRDSGEGTRFATKCDGVRARGAEQHTTWTTVAQLRVTRGAVSETSRQKFALGCLVPACLAARRRAEDRSRRERSSCIERRGRKGDSQSGLGTGEARAGERQGPAGNGRALRAGGVVSFYSGCATHGNEGAEDGSKWPEAEWRTAVCGHRERRDTKGASVVRERATLREAGAQGVGAADSHGA
ncbi:hypothetical protein ERJ75_000695300 [Trypanosoma vivax]|nr:hypothetical protein ERJ75_000695300 [Trypanosoma vivax]